MIYLIDLDGTMYEGEKYIDGAKEFIDFLNLNNKEYYFFTNNSTRTKEQNKEKMLQMNFENIDKNKFITSSMLIVRYIKKYYDIKEKNKVFVLGKDGIKSELLENGFELVEDNADFVVVALDEEANYNKYTKALQNILSGAVLFGTNSDRRYPTESGYKLGNGSIISMLEYASDKKSITLGKPKKESLYILKEMLNINKNEDLVIIGDNLETDIKLGKDSKIKTVFVQTGIHKREDIEKLKIYPDIVIENLKDLITKDFII